MLNFQLTKPVPDLTIIKSVQKLAWASAGGVFHLLGSPNEEAEIHKTYEKVSNVFACNATSHENS